MKALYQPAYGIPLHTLQHLTDTVYLQGSQQFPVDECCRLMIVTAAAAAVVDFFYFYSCQCHTFIAILLSATGTKHLYFLISQFRLYLTFFPAAGCCFIRHFQGDSNSYWLLGD